MINAFLAEDEVEHALDRADVLSVDPSPIPPRSMKFRKFSARSAKVWLVVPPVAVTLPVKPPLTVNPPLMVDWPKATAGSSSAAPIFAMRDFMRRLHHLRVLGLHDASRNWIN